MTVFPSNYLHQWARSHPKAKNALRLPGRLWAPIQTLGLRRAIAPYTAFFQDYLNFRRTGGSADVTDMFPMLHEKIQLHDFDPHYFHQAVWTAKKIAAAKPELHIDVGSQAVFVGMLTAITDIKFIDLRPMGVSIEGLTDEKGTILDLPMEDASVQSISCLHVIEHIGLGRYGDPIDPDGPRKAANELTRVLAPGGSLYISLPVGRSQTAFNAHRVLAAQQVVDMFGDLQLREFSLVNDDGNILADTPISAADNESFGCGLFHFERR